MKQLAQVHRAEVLRVCTAQIRNTEATCTSAQSRSQPLPTRATTQPRSNLHKCTEQKALAILRRLLNDEATCTSAQSRRCINQCPYICSFLKQLAQVHRAEAHQHIFKLLFFRSNLHKCTEQKQGISIFSVIRVAKQLAQVHRAEVPNPLVVGKEYRSNLHKCTEQKSIN